MLVRCFFLLGVMGCFVGAAWAEGRLGEAAFERGDFPAAIRELTPAAEQGDAAAETLLGVIYATGSITVPRDDKKAVAWWRRAADQGDAVAEDFVGDAYREGRGVALDQKEAASWYRRSAEHGYAIGQCNLGFAYAAGEGVKRDVKAAADWFQKSAAQDYAPAEEMLGRAYLRGVGVGVDEKLGVKWLHKAANQGLLSAEADLGMVYANGIGTRRDKVQAFKWLELALREIPAGKQREQIAAARKTIAEAMTSAQRERADALVAKFEPTRKGGKRVARNSTRQQSEPEPVGPIATGSGFVISAQGHIVTNDHVVAECGSFRVRHLGPDSMEASLVARDNVNDLAVLKIATPPGKFAMLRTGAEIRPGDGVVAIGFPLAGLLAEDANVTIGGVSALAGFRNDQRYLQISAPVQPGNSGGPLLDMSGNVIGVVSAKLDAARVAAATGDIPQNVNFAIKISVLRQFLDANEIPYRGAASAARLEAADVGEQARAFTALVECWK